MSTTASAAGTAVIEEKGEKGDTAGAAFDAVADLFPGGRMALEPFRNMLQGEAGENDLIRTDEKSPPVTTIRKIKNKKIRKPCRSFGFWQGFVCFST